MLALGRTAGGTVFEMWLWLRDPWHRGAYGQFDPQLLDCQPSASNQFLAQISQVGHTRARRPLHDSPSAARSRGPGDVI